MHKSAIYTLTFSALSLSACTQSPFTQAAQVSAKGKDIFNGEIWLRPGNERTTGPGKTLYLREAKHQEIPTNALSLPTLHMLFGIDEVEGIIAQKKVNYISE